MSEQGAATGPHRLRRLVGDRRLGGVCAGIAAQLGIDPVVLRVLVFVGAFVVPGVVLGYFLLWLVTPDDEGGHSGTALAVVGGGLATLGLLGGSVRYDAGMTELVVVTCVTVAIVVLVPRLPRRRPRAAAADEGPAAPALPTWWEIRHGPADRGPSSVLAGLAVGVALMVTGFAALVGAPARTVAAVALLAVAAGLLVGAVRGNGRPLVPVAAAAALALATTHYATVPAATETYGTYIRPASIGELRNHTVLAGAVTLDLSDTEWLAGAGTMEPRIDVVAGHVVVILPDPFRGKPGERIQPSLSYDASVWAGTYDNAASSFGGTGIGQGSRRSSGPDPGVVHVDLFVRVRFGTLEIRDATT